MTYSVTKDWLMEQYSKSNVKNSQIDVWYENVYNDNFTYEHHNENRLDMFKVELPSVEDQFYVKHHSKMSLYYYRDDNTLEEFLRVVVMTANLTYDDWNTHNQGIWISPKCELSPTIPTTKTELANGESLTKFKATLLAYLHHYRNDNRNLHMDNSCKRWIQHVRRANFKNIRVVLIASAPGIYDTELVIPKSFYPCCSESDNMPTLQNYFCNSHNIITKILEFDDLSKSTWYIIAQSSTIGQLSENGLLKELFPCLTTTATSQPNPNVWIIYPSEEDFQSCVSSQNPATGFINLGGLFYNPRTHVSQIWIEQHLRRWSAERTGRTRILPHIKSCCRVSPDSKKLSWFLLTSCCLTTTAWGCPYFKDGSKRVVANYEMGVLFFPTFFDDDYFAIEGVNGNGRTFPLMYDVKHPYGKPHFR
ncbi:tyrosyl-dna phosphodiesterase 1 [Holotrichia oblita]|uniref:Tyrosyl-dna phosphodiesterase 1 n=1 Tax=Holotrichia oblita TaxID=644536 RepID=A0ACB9TCM4_HOLOL|nr:tyrosyl-dna phosphodiesterase 1 [Holotrichia oblita]